MGQEWHRCCAQALPHCSRPGFLPKRQPQPCCLLSHEKQCTEAKPPAFSSLWHPNSGKNEDQPEEFHPPLFLKHLIYNFKQPGHLASSLCLVLWHLLWLLQFPAWEGWKFHDSPPPFKQVPALGLSHPWWDDLQSKAFLTWAHWALSSLSFGCRLAKLPVLPGLWKEHSQVSAGSQWTSSEDQKKCLTFVGQVCWKWISVRHRCLLSRREKELSKSFDVSQWASSSTNKDRKRFRKAYL